MAREDEPRQPPLLELCLAAQAGDLRAPAELEVVVWDVDEGALVSLGRPRSLHGALRMLGSWLLERGDPEALAEALGDDAGEDRAAIAALKSAPLKAIVALERDLYGLVASVDEDDLEDSPYLDALAERFAAARLHLAFEAAPPAQGFAVAIVERADRRPGSAARPLSVHRCAALVDANYSGDLKAVNARLAASLAAGQDPNAVDEAGDAPIHVFLSSGYYADESDPAQLVEFVRLLVGGGAKDLRSASGTRASAMAQELADDEPERLAHYGEMARLLRAAT